MFEERKRRLLANGKAAVAKLGFNVKPTASVFPMASISGPFLAWLAALEIPTQSEFRERALRELVRNSKKPVVLFVDEAHDLHFRTLRGLKRLCEVVADGGAVLSIVLAGHPKLRNALLRPNMDVIRRGTLTPVAG
ncbi:MAG TPA: AAA family ATPase [Stellaceae bacterium]|nr:AAA family ATPase [Stellaceae bacterium]